MAVLVDKNTRLCRGQNCNLRDDCYRYRAEPRYLQEYITPPPIKDGSCDKFISAKDAVMVNYDDMLFLRMGDFND